MSGTLCTISNKTTGSKGLQWIIGLIIGLALFVLVNYLFQTYYEWWGLLDNTLGWDWYLIFLWAPIIVIIILALLLGVGYGAKKGCEDEASKVKSIDKE